MSPSRDLEGEPKGLDVVIACSLGVGDEPGKPALSDEEFLPLATRLNPHFGWLVSAVHESFANPGRRTLINYSPGDIASGHSCRDFVRAQSLKLLERLQERRDSDQGSRDPIIFIGHELGGIIIKDAITVAALNKHKYHDICISTRLFVFFDCFHRATTPWETVNWVARWLPPAADARSPILLHMIKALAATIDDVNELFLETKFPQLAQVASVYSSGVDGSATNLDEFSGTLGTLREQRFRLTGDHARDEYENDLTELARAAATLPDSPTQREWAHIVNHLLPPTRPVIRQNDLKDGTLGWMLADDVYLKWLKTTGPSALQLYGPMSHHALQLFYQDATNQSANKDLIFLHFIFDRHDRSRNSATAMATSLVAQILCYDSAFGNDHWFQQRWLSQAWSLHDSLCFLMRSIVHRSVTCTLENLDQCERNSLGQFLEVFNNNIMLAENNFKLLATAEDAMEDWPGKSLNLALQGLSDSACVWPTYFETADKSEDMVDSPEPYQRTDERVHSVSSPVEDQKKQLEILAKETNPDNPLAQECLDLLFKIPDTALRDTLVAQLFNTGAMAPLDRLRSFHEPVSSESFFRESLNQMPDCYRDIVRQVMVWVLLAVRPLSVQELSTIVLWMQCRELPDKSRLTKESGLRMLFPVFDLLWGFLVIDHNQVRVSHPAVRDLFQGPGSDWFKIGDDGHGQIVNTCLEFLELPDFVSWEEESNGIEYTFAMGTMVLPRATFKDRSSLHQYVIMNWPEHYKQIPACKRPRKAVEMFFMGVGSPWQSWAVTRWVLSNPLTRGDQPGACHSPLPLLAELGDVELLRDWMDMTGETDPVAGGLALVAAARERNKDVAEYLLALEYGRPRVSDLQSALLAAASTGEREVLLLLILSAPDNFPWPPALIVRASELGFEECVSALLLCGYSRSAPMGSSGTTALLEAARNGHGSICDLLLEYGAEAGADGHSQSIMTAAASYPNGAEVIRVFAGHQLDVMEKDSEGQTALGECCKNGNFKVAEALADVVRQSGHNLSSSEISACLGAAVRNQFVRTMEPVLDILSLEPDRGQSVLNEHLIKAVDSGSVEVARLLLQRGADVNSAGESDALLWEACNKSDISMDLVTLRVEHGADLESLGNNHTPLKRAAIKGHLGCVGYLIERGARVNQDPGSGSSPLGLAAREGHLECVKCLLENGAEIDWRDQYGESAVFDAAANQHYDIVDFLLDKGASASGQGWDGRSLVEMCISCPGSMRKVLERCPETDYKDDLGLAPLHYAAHQNNAEAINVLLEFKADVDIEGSESQGRHTPLMKAAKNGDEEAVRALLEGGANVDHKAMPDGFTALHHGVGSPVFGALLEYRPDVDATAQEGRTPLYYECTAREPDLAVIQRLLNAGANINAQTESGSTPLMRLAGDGKQSAVEYLLSKGADPTIVSTEGETAFALACPSGNLQLVKRLYAAGSRSVVPSVGLTPSPLQATCMDLEADQEALDIIRYLVLELNTDVNQIAGHFGTAVATACLRSTPDALNLLLECHADPNITDHVGRLPIHLAALNSPASLQALVKHGCDVRAADKTGRTILQWAAQSGRVELVRLALSLPGVEVNQASDDGWTALCWAARGVASKHYSPDGTADGTPDEQTDIVQLLLEKGADRSVLCRGDSGQRWTPLQVAIFHGQDRKLTELLVVEETGAETKPNLDSAGSSQRKGNAHDGWVCDICLSDVVGTLHQCKTCQRNLDFCFRCYFHREKIHDPSHEFEQLDLTVDESDVVEDDVYMVEDDISIVEDDVHIVEDDMCMVEDNMMDLSI